MHGAIRLLAPALVVTLAWLVVAGALSDEAGPVRHLTGSRRNASVIERGRPAAHVRTGSPVAVVVDARHPRAPVPADFLGLSFEVADLPRIARYADRGDLVALMRALGPGVMRFGGVSADKRAPVSQPDLHGIARLAAKTGWRVLLTVGLGHYSPREAAREARFARVVLGARLAAIEVGNEPDSYVGERLRGAGWSVRRYRRQVDAYRAAIHATAPTVPIAGPDASSGEGPLRWVRAEAAERPALLTDHYYPSTSCGYKPPLSDLLSPNTRRAETAVLSQLAAISAKSGIPLRLDETNNISCGGEAGVSNTFGAALWAVDYVARAMTAGLSGLAFHDLVERPFRYGPLAARGRLARSRGALHANPEWYALLLARRLLGNRPVRARVVPRNSDLTASALLSASGRLHVVLVDYAAPGATQLFVRLRVSRQFSGGSILRLTARSAGSTAGIKLGGRAVTKAGVWRPARNQPGVYSSSRSLSLAMSPHSAALVTLYPSG